MAAFASPRSRNHSQSGRFSCRRRVALLLLGTLLLAGCWTESGPQVVVYTALDREFSEPIFDDFTAETGIQVLARYDTESTKTVGLANALLAEKDRPRCDLFWNNEILNTLRIDRAGLLAAFDTPAAQPFPPMFRDPQHRWVGFAARARVIIVNTERVPEEERPQSVTELADPRWRGEVGLAKPLFGTTATHAACLFALWGPDEAEAFFSRVHGNAKILSGNKQVALAVARGELKWGLTDTDDAIIELDRGEPVAIIYPDQQPEEPGTLRIPNTLGLIEGGPHPEPARRLVEYLLQPEVEARLATGASAQFPLHEEASVVSRAAPPAGTRWMEISFPAAADQWDRAATFLRDTFATAD